MERQERRGEEQSAQKQWQGNESLQEEQVNIFTETQVENKGGGGRERVGREQEEELSHPTQPNPTPPLAPQKKTSLCGKQVMLG